MYLWLLRRSVMSQTIKYNWLNTFTVYIRFHENPQTSFLPKSEPYIRKIAISGCYLMLRKPLLVGCCFVVSVSFIFVSVFCTWLPQVRKCSGKINFLQGQGRLREFHSESGKIEVFERNQEKWNFKSTFVHFTDMNGVVLVEYFSWKWTICRCWVLKEMIESCLPVILRNLSIHLRCTWLAKSINKWVAGGGGWLWGERWVHYQD